MPRRFFLSWSQPVLPAVVDYLTAGWDAGPLDLAHLVAVVPTAEAGRRLKEALAMRAAARQTAVLSPHVITPEVITGWAMQEMPPTATPADTLLTWMRELQDVPLDEYAALFPVPPVSRDEAWARSTAGELLQLRRRLEEGGRTMADAARRLGTEHPEAERWQELAKLEARAAAALKRHGLADAVHARLAAASHPVFPPGVTRVVLLAVPDPVHLVVMALGAAERQGMPVDHLIHSDDSLADAFDEWGRPLPESWGNRIIDIPESAERIRLLPRPNDEAAALVSALQKHGGVPDAIAVGSADPAVAAPFQLCAARAGFAVFDPNGIPLGNHELTWMLTCLAGMLRSDSAASAAQLLRLPEVLRAAHAGVLLDQVLGEWDEFQQAQLPRTLSDAVALVETWTPRRRHGTEVRPPALRAVLQWLHDQRRQMLSANDSRPLNQFIDAVYSGRQFLSAPEHALFHEAMEQWLEMLGAIDVAAQRTGLRMDAASQLETALYLLRDSRLYPDNTENLPVLSGWLELPWQDAPHLAVAGMNEGMAPDSITGDPWLPDSVRGLLDLKTNATRLARDSYLLTSLIESRRGSGSVLLLAARESPAGDPLKPSRLLLRCAEAELPALVLRLFPAGEEEARPSPPSWHRAWKLRLPAPDPDAGVFKSISVTQFSDYLKCPFRFYLKHVLRMEPFDAARDEMDPRDFGSLIHDSIQQLHLNETLRHSSDEAALAGFLDSAVCHLAAARYGADPALPLVFQLESARNRLRALARIQAAARAAGWRIEHVEVSFPELPDNKEPVKLDGVLISGRIDLIERHLETGQIRVIDYKTGSKGTAPEAAHLKPLRGAAADVLPDWQKLSCNGKPHAWTNLQLPLYAWIVGRLSDGGATAGYINLPPAITGAGVKMWDELTNDMILAAVACSRGVIRNISKGIFWPPARTVDFDDFESLSFGDIEESFDPAVLEKVPRASQINVKVDFR